MLEWSLTPQSFVPILAGATIPVDHLHIFCRHWQGRDPDVSSLPQEKRKNAYGKNSKSLGDRLNGGTGEARKCTTAAYLRFKIEGLLCVHEHSID